MSSVKRNKHSIWQHIVIISLLFYLALPSPAAAVDDSEILAQIDDLLKIVLQLQERLDLVESKSTQPTQYPTPKTTSYCPVITRSLARGIRGADVSALQTFLRSTGDYTYPEITGYYGSVTEIAVQYWQARNNVVSRGTPASTGFGVFGPASQAALTTICTQYADPYSNTSIPQNTDCHLSQQCGSLSSIGTPFHGIHDSQASITNQHQTAPSVHESGNSIVPSYTTSQGNTIDDLIGAITTQKNGQTLCLSFEVYDPITNSCSVKGTTNTSTAYDTYVNEAYDFEAAGFGSVDDTPSGYEVETFDHKGIYESKNSPFVIYRVDDDLFELSQKAYNLSQEEQMLADNTPQHRALWNLVKTIFNEASSGLFDTVIEFSIFSDGLGETVAYVQTASYDLRKWMFAVDSVDALQSDGRHFRDPEQFFADLIHEFGHIVTLDLNQRDYTLNETECTTYYAGYGNCTKSNSYLNIFFTTFWNSAAHREYRNTVSACTTNCTDLTYDFYGRYADQFVSVYAASNPDEDIAESFAHFILGAKPTTNSVRAQKVLFFYQFPELVTLRKELHRGLLKADEAMTP